MFSRWFHHVFGYWLEQGLSESYIWEHKFMSLYSHEINNNYIFLFRMNPEEKIQQRVKMTTQLNWTGPISPTLTSTKIIFKLIRVLLICCDVLLLGIIKIEKIMWNLNGQVLYFCFICANHEINKLLIKMFFNSIMVPFLFSFSK